MSMNDLYSCENLQSKKEQQDFQAFCRTNENDNLPIRSNLVQVPTAQQKICPRAKSRLALDMLN